MEASSSWLWSSWRGSSGVIVRTWSACGRARRIDLIAKNRKAIMISQSHTIRVGILGFGTVGQGTWKHLVENAQSLKKILGVEVLPTRASVRDLSKDRKLRLMRMP